MIRPRQSLARLFAAPLAIGMAMIAGLVLGLTGDGIGDVAAWTLTAIAPLMLLLKLYSSHSSLKSHHAKGPL